MGRKITHTKRGIYYNGPTGRRKVSAPFGALFSAAGSSKNKKSSTSYSSSFNYCYSGNSNDRNSTAGCIFVSIIIILFVIFEGYLLSKCSGSKKHKRWQHPERYKPRNNIVLGNIADPWHCLNNEAL